jgi:hypothetical protein
MIDSKKFYTLGEIVREKLLPNVDTVIKASNLVKTDKMRNKILNAKVVPRGGNIMYKVKGENIIKYLAQKDEQTNNS